jgi:CHAT domain-containing protein
VLICLAVFFLLARPAPPAVAQAAPGAPCKAVHSGKGEISLERRKPVLTSMSGGETHAYSIKVKPGEFVHVVVTQKGIDVALLLVDKTSTKVVPYGKERTFDSPNGTIGQEFVSFIRDKSGSDEAYQLRISSTEGAPPGCYQVEITEQREAVSQDKDVVFVEDSFLNAFSLRSQEQEVPMLQAVEILEKTLARPAASRNRYLLAEILNLLGYVYYFLGNDRNSPDFIEKALITYRRALPLWRPLQDPLNEAVTLNGIANALDWMNHKTEALPYYSRAVKIWAADKSDPGAWGIGLMNIAFVHDMLGDKEGAISFYKQALPHLQEGGDIEKLHLTLGRMAGAYSYLGEYEAGLEPLNKSLSLSRSPGTANRKGEAGALKGLGLFYNSAGDKQTALKYLNEALPIFQELQDVRGQADTINSIGAVSARRGATPEELTKALTLLNNAKNLYANVHDPDPSDQAATFNNIGGIYFLLGDYGRAVENFNSSLALIQIGIQRHTHYASVDRNSEARCLYNIARAEKARKEFSGARAAIERAVGIIQATRTNIRDPELRVSYLASVKFYYEFYIELLMELSEQDRKPELVKKAFEVSEGSRARSLLDMLISTSRVRASDPRYRALTQPPTLADIQANLDRDTLLLEFSLGEQRGFLWAVTRNSFDKFVLPERIAVEKAVDEVYNRLIARNVKIDFEEEPDKKKRIAEADEELPGFAKALSEMLLKDVATQLEGKRLLIVADGRLHYVPFAALPAPSALKLSNDQKALFPDARPPLLATNEIVNIPSASVLTIIRERAAARRSALRSIATLADPVFDKDDERLSTKPPAKDADPCKFPTADQVEQQERAARADEGEDEKSRLKRLPLTRCEAKRIMEYAPKGSLSALDFDANGALVRSGKLGKFGIIHFATHSRVNNIRPELSSIVLSRFDRRGNPRTDAYVRARDLYSLSFPVNLVVLSSCKTGLGKNVEGEGLIGLTRGFIYAGASRVVVSLWDVNDVATTTLMSDFYRKMFTGPASTSQALRNAQLDMLKKDPQLPSYFWAAFILQGEWR